MENPAVLFDKSVFQETAASAFVAADRYIEIVVPPILVREIGGDLATSNAKRRERDQQAFVAKLARRAGNRAFVAHHGFILQHDLIGCPTAMDGRTPIMMDPVPRPGGRGGLFATQTPEEFALNRWRQGDFSPLDHLWAHRWQRVQKMIRSRFYARTLEKIGLKIAQPRSLEELQQSIDDLMRNPRAQAKLLYILFCDFQVPMKYQELAIKRFQSKRPRELVIDFAPYAGFCLRANLLLGFSGELLPRPHPHDLRDLEYLYYLPFCEVFASEDRLHRRLAPILSRPNQMIVGRELGQDLKRLADAWQLLTPQEKVEFARTNRNMPPESDDSIVRAIWEQFRGPDVPSDDVVDPSPDQFFRNLLKRWGEEHILDIVQKPSFIRFKDEMLRGRLEELYPGASFDEGK